MAKAKILKLENPIEIHFNKLTRYHYIFLFLIFSSKIPIFWHVLSLIFLSPPMDYTCNDTKSANSTNLCPCSEPSWNTSIFTETMQTKFGLYCETNWLISFSQSMFYVGLLIGALVFGFFSDKYGRLSMFITCCLILAVSGCLVSFMPTPISFIFMRTIEGIGTGGTIITSYVLCVEYCGVRHRETITALFHIPINIGHMTLPGVSYMFRNFDEFQLAVSIPIFLFVGLRWMIMESPKWLMDRDRIDEAVAIMEKINNYNKTSSEQNIREQIEEYNAHHSNHKSRRITFFQIFLHKKLALNFAYMSFMYFLCGLGYYGISQYIGSMSGNIHLNVAISGVLLLPGTIIAIFLLRLLNRRTFLTATIFLSGLFIIITILIPLRFNFAKVVFACICNCFFFMSFIIVFLFGVELFPTSVRSSNLGMLSLISRLGQIVGPLVNSLPDFAAGSIFGALALFGTFICYLLPETKNIELPASLDDSKVLSRKKTVVVEDNA